ncbi:hypothetical protein LCGC14_3148120, partial [marine sediment metagenome]
VLDEPERARGMERLLDAYLTTLPGPSGTSPATEIDEEINNLIEQMKNMTERELMDQVYVRVAIHLCGRCYRQWIENPAG